MNLSTHLSHPRVPHPNLSTHRSHPKVPHPNLAAVHWDIWHKRGDRDEQVIQKMRAVHVPIQRGA